MPLARCSQVLGFHSFSRGPTHLPESSCTPPIRSGGVRFCAALPYKGDMATLAARVSPQPSDLQRRALVGLRSADAQSVPWGRLIVGSLLSGAIVMGAGYFIGRVTA